MINCSLKLCSVTLGSMEVDNPGRINYYKIAPLIGYKRNVKIL